MSMREERGDSKCECGHFARVHSVMRQRDCLVPDCWCYKFEPAVNRPEIVQSESKNQKWPRGGPQEVENV